MVFVGLKKLHLLKLISLKLSNDLHKETAMKIYKNLKDKQFEVLYDDRSDRLGKKIKDSNLLGIPINIVIGKKFKDEKQVEVIERNNEKKLVKESELVNYLTKFFQE